MPRRRKHRKHAKSRQKKQQASNPNRQGNVQTNNTITELTNDVHSSTEDHTMSDTLVSSTTRSYSTPMRLTRAKKDSFELETPVRRIPFEVICFPLHQILVIVRVIVTQNLILETPCFSKKIIQ